MAAASSIGLLSGQQVTSVNGTVSRACAYSYDTAVTENANTNACLAAFQRYKVHLEMIQHRIDSEEGIVLQKAMEGVAYEPIGEKPVVKPASKPNESSSLLAKKKNGLNIFGG